MSKEQYFAQYESPNICIVPNESSDSPSPKRPKQDEVDREEVNVSFLDDIDVDEIIQCLKVCAKEATENRNSNQRTETDCDESNTQKMDKIDCCNEQHKIEILATKKDNMDTYTDSSIATVATSNTKTDKTQIEKAFEIDRNKGLEKNTKVVSNNKTIDNKKVAEAPIKDVDTNQRLNVKDTVLPNRDDAMDLHTLSLILEQRFPNYFNVKFSWLTEIHSGKYSDIFKCMVSDGRHYAVKAKYNHLGFRIKHIMKVIRADIPEDNLFCVNIIPAFQIQGRWCFLMEWYPINLKEVLEETEKNFHIDMIKELALQLVTALTTLKYKNIIHSDIQPKHILLDATKRKLKLCGFDEAFFVGSSIFQKLQGPKLYQGPEILLGYAGDFSMDVWSAALVIHEMATGRQVFGSCHEEHILNKQICILGHLPYEMVVQSRFRDKYNIHYCVEKYRCRTHKQPFGAKENLLARMIHGAYFKHWVDDRNPNQKIEDLNKIDQLIYLLNQMLIQNPVHRLPIEYVCQHPFFT